MRGKQQCHILRIIVPSITTIRVVYIGRIGHKLMNRRSYIAVNAILSRNLDSVTYRLFWRQSDAFFLFIVFTGAWRNIRSRWGRVGSVFSLLLSGWRSRLLGRHGGVRVRDGVMAAAALSILTPACQKGRFGHILCSRGTATSPGTETKIPQSTDKKFQSFRNFQL